MQHFLGSKISPPADAVRHPLCLFTPRFFGCWLGGWGGANAAVQVKIRKTIEWLASDTVVARKLI